MLLRIDEVTANVMYSRTVSRIFFFGHTHGNRVPRAGIGPSISGTTKLPLSEEDVSGTGP